MSDGVTSKDLLLQKSYGETLKDLRFSFSRGGGVTAIILILCGVGLDYGLYPIFQEQFAIARVIASLLVFILMVVLHSEWGREHVRSLTFVWMLVPQIMITWMVAKTEGANSIFYAGLNLAIFASGIVMTFHFWQNIFFGAVTCVLYIFACSFHPESFILRGAFLVNLLFLTFAVVLSAVLTYFNEQARFMLFRLKAEVAEKNKALELINNNLADIKGQMLQQEKMAALGTLSSGLLHEVNNPVNFSLMAVELALEEPDAKLNSNIYECLVDAKQGMQRIQHIVSDLKTFAYRKPEGQQEAPFLFEKALLSAIRLLGHELKGIELTNNLPDDTLVKGDEAAIIGVLINLLSNAVLAFRKGQTVNRSITIAAFWQDADRLQVDVLDNGPGIAPENLPRIFEPFFTTRDIGQGLGLGLSISYRVIEQHGGCLLAQSEYGQWTKMTFDLPKAG